MESVHEPVAGRRFDLVRSAAVTGAYLLAWIVVAVVVWQRIHFPQWAGELILVVFFAAGFVVDLKWEGFRERPLLERAVIGPLLLLLCLVPMLSLLFFFWTGELQSEFVTGGLLPYSDASAWVCGAKSLLATGELNAVSGHRPLGICMIASLLALTDENYQQALILLVGIAGVATFFAAKETWRAGGVAAAILFIFLSSNSIAPWLPLFLNVTPGYIFGCLGFAFLLRGFRTDSLPWSLAGLGFMVLAIFARPGAILVVPFLAIYICYWFARSGWREFCGKLAIVVAVWVLAAAVNPLMRHFVAPEGTRGGNTFYMLYSLAAGGGNWNRVFTDHPKIAGVADSEERNRAVRTLFWKKFGADPAVLPATVLRFACESVSKFPDILFPAFRPLPPSIPGAIVLAAVVLLLRPAWKRRGPWSFLVVAIAGVLLSIPFVVPGGFRHLAPAYPMAAGLAAAAIGLLTAWLRKLEVDASGDSMVFSWERDDVEERGENGQAPRLPSILQPVFAVVVVASVSVFPLIQSMRAELPPLPESSRNPDGSWREIVFYHHPQSGVMIANDSRFGKHLEISREKFLRLGGMCRHVEMDPVIHSGRYICEVFPLGGGGTFNYYLMFPDAVRGRAGFFKATVRPITLSTSPVVNLYLVEKYRVL